MEIPLENKLFPIAIAIPIKPLKILDLKFAKNLFIPVLGLGKQIENSCQMIGNTLKVMT